MRPIWVLAINTYKEVIRDRILYALVLFAFLLVGLSMALGQLSFAEQARISADFGLSAIHLCTVVLAIFVGSNLVAKEIEKKTILTILVRPISRLQFIMGKALGLTMLIVTMLVGLSLVLAVIFWGLGVAVNGRLAWVLVGLLAEALVLLGVTLVFSMISKPLLVVAFSVGIFLIGHWQNSLRFFASKSEGGGLKPVAWLVEHFMPNLERVNWKDIVIYDQPVDYTANLLSLGYMLAWFAVCIAFCAILFKRKDLG
jgi:Cu-processing system permease protein